jgi:hypothetical protein
MTAIDQDPAEFRRRLAAGKKLQAAARTLQEFEALN